MTLPRKAVTAGLCRFHDRRGDHAGGVAECVDRAVILLDVAGIDALKLVLVHLLQLVKLQIRAAAGDRGFVGRRADHRLADSIVGKLRDERAVAVAEDRLERNAGSRMDRRRSRRRRGVRARRLPVLPAQGHPHLKNPSEALNGHTLFPHGAAARRGGYG